MSKEEQKDPRAKYFREKEEKNKRIDRWFYAIELVILGLTITLCFYNWQLAIVSFIWLIVSLKEYGKGCEWMCIDEIDMPDSAFGLRFMFKKWKILLPLLTIGAVLLLLNWWVIAIVYGVFAFFVYALSCEIFG